MKYIVNTLASIGEKSVRYPDNLNTAKDYIIEKMGNETIIQEYIVNGIPCYNLEYLIEGAFNNNKTIIVAAHYDTLYSGANDNCTGIAALLYLQEYFKDKLIDKNLKFVAFTNEEPPFYMTNQMGSIQYTNQISIIHDIENVFVLDLIGCYYDEEGTQYTPTEIQLNNTKGNFVCFTSVNSNLDEIKSIFQEVGNFPIEIIKCKPNSFLERASDHYAFSRLGIPATLVTDTAMFRYPYYHSEEDTTDKINFEEMTKMVENFKLMLKEMIGVIK